MLINTSDPESIKPFIEKLYIPPTASHKGQNGKVLIIGGSSLFHSASIWSALTASHFVDMVHYASTQENNEVMTHLKKKFHGGIIVAQKEILSYTEEDDTVLVGPGMMRGKVVGDFQFPTSNFQDILNIKDEPTFTFALLGELIHRYPTKKFVFDAGAIQMMDVSWLSKLKVKPILTPHQKEFEDLFGEKVSHLSMEDKKAVVEKNAKNHNCIILMRAVSDIVSDGETTCEIRGGNAGLTKGGTGDVLAGLTAGLFTKSGALNSCIIASYLLKRASDSLFLRYGYWYNVDTLIDTIPQVAYESYKS